MAAFIACHFYYHHHKLLVLFNCSTLADTSISSTAVSVNILNLSRNSTTFITSHIVYTTQLVLRQFYFDMPVLINPFSVCLTLNDTLSFL